MKATDFWRLDETVAQWVEAGYYSGASVLVVQDGLSVFRKTYGDHHAESAEFIASAGKWLAAATIAALVDEGRLSWDVKVSYWLPEFSGAKGEATLRQQLSHTAGYPAYQPQHRRRDDYQTLAESVAHIAALPAEAQPGAAFNYGGLAMQVAGRIAELATGKDWEAIFEQKIAIPLGMQHTHFTPVDGGEGHSPMLAGGARSSLRDYGRFLNMIYHEGIFEGRRILSKAAVREMQKDQVGSAVVNPGEYVEFRQDVYGLGVWREELDAVGQAVLVSSPGWAGAYPWIDKRYNVYGFMLAHVDANKAAAVGFSSFRGSAVLPWLVRQSIDTARRGLVRRALTIGAVLLSCLLPAFGAQTEHPRLMLEPAPAQKLAALKARVQPYVDRHRDDPAWIVSRLQMYWQEKRTQVYVKNGYYDHASGEAPAPTVRFTGARDTATAYATPKLEDVKPYMGEHDLLYLQNKTAPGQPWEWVGQAKTGRIVESINMRIAELARDAALLYWSTGDESYARFAYDIFDAYMTGLYYRETPLDLNRGHDQTLVGLQSFEVIHEDIAGPLAETYDFMHAYVARRAGAKRALFDAAFKKWADLIIANGVPWNNWNLIKARFVLQIAAVLDADERYTDKRGSGHYVHAVIDGSGPRQWSLQRLLDHGYDPKTAMWNESPGYSVNVVGDYLECLDMLDRVFGIDLLPAMPVLPRAVKALPQYLLPNGRMVGFGDTRYEFVRTAAIERLQAYAERHGRSAEAQDYAALIAAIRSASDGAAASKVRDYQTPTFYTPNASWLVQRNGAGRDNAVAISQVGSAGNHAHANGIAMELYAQGFSLAPESGRGSGYFQNDHSEYYSQFPAHNTVVVDGKSSYPSMKSDHPLALQAVYPAPGSPAVAAFPWATFSDVRFLEPETDADQQRVLGTIRLDDKSAYFVDIFRSRRRDGKDKYHDYIYHNLGQSLRFSDAGRQPLAVAASPRLSFSDGDLIGYDYWQDRQSLKTAGPLKARFDLKLPDRAIAMNAWLQGAANREFFSVLAPPSTAWPAGMLPAGLDNAPLPTLVIRQSGQAWSHPFTAVLEAARDDTPGAVLGVEEIVPAGGHAIGLRVSAAGGRHQTIISNDADSGVFAHAGQRLAGRYGIVAERDGALDYLFLGHGREVAGQGYAIVTLRDGSAAAVWQQQGHWFYTGTQPAQLQVPAASWPRELELREGGRVTRVRGRNAGQTRVFELPAMAAARIR